MRFETGNVSMNNAMAKRLSPAMRNAIRAQKSAGSLPASLLAWVTLHPDTEKSEKGERTIDPMVTVSRVNQGAKTGVQNADKNKGD